MRIDYINNLGPEYDKYKRSFYYYAKKAIKLLEIEDNFLLEVQIVDNKEIHKINKMYRDIDRATDVISFAFDDEVGENEVKIKDNHPRLLGMIVISGDKANEQAKEYGHSLDREMKFLFIHGFLHLLGYDHQTAEDEATMTALQTKIIGKRHVL
jgi:probable rRNA maturation factor